VNVEIRSTVYYINSPLYSGYEKAQSQIRVYWESKLGNKKNV